MSVPLELGWKQQRDEEGPTIEPFSAVCVQVQVHVSVSLPVHVRVSMFV